MTEKILSLIRHHSMTDDFNKSTPLSDIMDSVDIAELSFDLESEFNFKCTIQEWNEVFQPEQTVSRIVEFVKSKNYGKISN